MDKKFISIRKSIVINAILIIISTILAIVVHALMPATADVTQFDSIFVKWFGFTAVAMFYFIVLFTQCSISVGYIGRRANVPKLQVGIRFGIAFAITYLIGMQEVMLKGSPFSTWGIEFVKYQFIMGLGDGIPTMLLCFTIAFLTLTNNRIGNQLQKLSLTKNIEAILIIAIAIFIGRAIGYESGLIVNYTSLYPVACYLWTGCFGISMGCIYVILHSLLSFEKNHSYIPLKFVATIGVNWIIFNCFIGLIIKGFMPQMLFRSGVDVIILFISSAIINKYIMGSSN